jgi:hypothetical protein
VRPLLCQARRQSYTAALAAGAAALAADKAAGAAGAALLAAGAEALSRFRPPSPND